MLSILRTIVSYPLHLLKGVFQALAVVLLVLSSTVLIAGLFSAGIGPNHQWSSLFDLLSHLRLPCLMAQLISFLFFFALKDKPWMFATAIMLTVNLVDIVPYYLPQSKPFSAESGSLKVLQWNVLKDNRSVTSFVQMVQEKKPDVIGLEEVDQEWLTSLNVPLRAYPYRILLPQDNNFGIALYSKLPLNSQQVAYWGAEHKPSAPSQGFDPQKMAQDLWNKMFPPDTFPSIVASIHYRGQPVTLIVTHPLPPFSGFEMRNKQMAEMAIYAGRVKTPLVVMGDFNCSPWSFYFKEFLKNSALKDTQMGYGLQPSWPNWSGASKGLGFLRKKVPPFLAFWIQTPIDHVLVSHEFIVLNRQLGPIETKSDHLPVFAELALDNKDHRI